MHSKIDLNLFHVLINVYQEGSITAAAKKLHLTQPAVSHALARLRTKFDDELFIRHGRKMVPSALCQQILPKIKHAINDLESTLIDNSEFDIHQHKRQFNFGFRDIMESTFFPKLITDLALNTPNITVNSRQITQVEMEQALTEQDLDIVIDVLMPVSRNINHTLICNEQFSLICRRNHPILEDLTLENYANASHAVVTLKDSVVSHVDMALAKLGATRKRALQCEHYFAATSVVSQCDMLLTMPNAYASILRDKMPVEVTHLPFDVPSLPVHMYWHKQAEHDSVNGWMRNKLLNIAKELF